MNGLLAALAITIAQPAPAMAPASIEAAAWLAGRWVGEGLGGQIEETWAPPADGQMVGHFRLVKDGKLVFYELMLLDVVPAGIRMRVKHFRPDFVGWEEKDGWHSFEPVSAAANELRFRGLTIRGRGNEAEIDITLRSRDGKVSTETIRLRRDPR